MGQKVNPHGLRVGVIKDWDSKWYADGDFADYSHSPDRISFSIGGLVYISFD